MASKEDDISRQRRREFIRSERSEEPLGPAGRAAAAASSHTDPNGCHTSLFFFVFLSF